MSLLNMVGAVRRALRTEIRAQVCVAQAQCNESQLFQDSGRMTSSQEKSAKRQAV